MAIKEVSEEEKKALRRRKRKKRARAGKSIILKIRKPG